MVVTLLAGAWGIGVAWPFAWLARRITVRDRARRLRTAPFPRRERRWERAPHGVQVVSAVLRAPARHRARRAHNDAMRRSLPVAVDLLAVAVGAGCTPYTAVELASQWCPPNIGGALAGVVDRCRMGASFDDALRATARSEPVLAPIADALVSAAQLGAPIGPTLARLAAECRADLRRAAEQRARTTPVRLLFPLVFLVLPAFALLTVVPVVLAGFAHQ